MSTLKKKISLMLALSLLLFAFGANPASAQVLLYTPYTGLAVTPGETIDYSVDVINEGNDIQHLTFDMQGLPEGWEYQITSGGKAVQQLSVRGNEEESLTVEVNVPFDVEQEVYEFTLVATDQNGNRSILPFIVTLTEEGTDATELNVDQPNLQGQTDSSFSYSATIRNRTANEQNYALTANAPEGWAVVFKSGGDNITSITVEPNSEKDLTIDVIPPENASADTYEIEVSAAGSGTQAETTLETVITGSYDLVLTTQNETLSTDIQAGGERVIDLVIQNNGTAPVTNVELSASTPTDWETEFDKSTIPEIGPGESATVKAVLTASNEAIAGDYVTTFTASAQETSAEADIRVSVKTSTAWGIVSILIIGAIVVGIYYLMRKYGRR